MRPIGTAASLVALLLSLAPTARADVTYRFSPAQIVGFPDPTITDITVTDAAITAGSLSFSATCLSSTIPSCGGIGDPQYEGWVSGFLFPEALGIATVNLEFLPGGLLSGNIEIQYEDSDIGFVYQGNGTDWTTTCIDGPGEFDGTGFYQAIADPSDPPSVPEPAALWVLGLGLAGIIAARRRRIG